ncbi:MAG: hypothetical protein ACKVY0_01345 [Prosthecobacter sp.]|uniref:hypothetical protein n=1 Tax=Prosthecobacter sp. TaxID=1965333 RepID=UPI0039018265
MKKSSLEFRTVLSILLLISLAGVVYTMVYGPFPFHPQIRNLKAAERHIPALQPLLDQDPRFAKLKISPFTANGGCLSVSGPMNSETDFPDLKAIIDSSRPPVGVQYNLDLPTGMQFVHWYPIP